MKVTSINIFPVKSLGKISLDGSFAKERGFEHDRRIVLVDHMNNFITQRETPELTLISCELHGDNLKLTHRPTGDTTEFSITKFLDKKEEITIWGDVVRAKGIANEANAWISQKLNRSCRLMRMEQGDVRMVDSIYGKSEVSFADGFPYLLISEASLEDLNSRLEKSISMDQFRPNIVVDGLDAYKEDSLKIFKIGEAVFKKTNPCGRCVMTTIDQETAEISSEPLKTLSGYRKINNEVFFGINMICLKPGTVKVGDRLEMIEEELEKHR